MKLVALAALALPVAFGKLRTNGATLRGSSPSHHLLAVDISNADTRAGDLRFGKPECPCVGIDEVPGVKPINYGNFTIDYPADAGSHCNDWEHTLHPDCQKDSPPEWCAQQWCFVNPCDCDIPVPPKQSTYLTEATHQGMPLYFSYDTCGYDNSWTKEMAKDACPNQKTEEDCSKGIDCDWVHGECLPMILTKVCKAYLKRGGPADDWGLTTCPCIGIRGIPGDFEGSLNNQTVTMPSDTGSKCEAWYTKFDGYSCEGEHCEDKWCYVDPCQCNVSLEKAGFLASASHQGKPLYYSFETCGNPDRATATVFGHPGCGSASDMAACSELGEKCTWHRDVCVDATLPQMCEAFEKEVKSRQIHPVEIIGGEDTAISLDGPTTTTTMVDAAKRTAEEVKEYREFSR